jgi:hypothetical protein
MLLRCDSEDLIESHRDDPVRIPKRHETAVEAPSCGPRLTARAGGDRKGKAAPRCEDQHPS